MSDLSKRQEESVTEYMDPADAVKLVRRLRGVKFFVRTAAELVTQRPDADSSYRAMQLGGNVPVSARVAMEQLQDLARTNERRRDADRETGEVRITRLGDCLFIF